MTSNFNTISTDVTIFDDFRKVVIYFCAVMPLLSLAVILVILLT